jgi:hypothetical protein
MREILFRGLTAKGEWVHGSYIKTDIDAPAIVWGDGEQAEVIPETVGQYIGWTDTDGTKIFDGDIVANYNGSKVSEGPFAIKWETDAYRWGYHGNVDCALGFNGRKFLVVGNIHQNPELVKSLCQ